MIICKMVGHRYPVRGQSYGILTKHNVVELTDTTQIKSTITGLLNISDFDTVLVNYDKKLYVCEKAGDTYTRRVVTYHPLMDLVKI